MAPSSPGGKRPQDSQSSSAETLRSHVRTRENAWTLDPTFTFFFAQRSVQLSSVWREVFFCVFFLKLARL